MQNNPAFLSNEPHGLTLGVDELGPDAQAIWRQSINIYNQLNDIQHKHEDSY